eukprot:3702932-Pleurochrysis_carterae.AAC.1
MSAHAMPAQDSPAGQAGQAMADITGALRAARRAKESAPALELTMQPPAVNLKSTDLDEWKRWAALSLFRGRDGIVRFTEGRAMVRCRPGDGGGVEIQLLTTARGGSVATTAQALMELSDGVLPGVLTVRPRNGAWVPTLRVRGHAATISPLDGRPLAKAVELRTQGVSRVLPLAEAIAMMGLRWMTMDDDGDDDATQHDTPAPAETAGEGD